MSQTIARTRQEASEIERHKYFLSEKAGRDVGWEHAARDWDQKFGDEHRRLHQGRPGGGKGISFLYRRLFK